MKNQAKALHQYDEIEFGRKSRFFLCITGEGETKEKFHESRMTGSTEDGVK